jgi:hypothetical protein
MAEREHLITRISKGADVAVGGGAAIGFVLGLVAPAVALNVMLLSAASYKGAEYIDKKLRGNKN